MLCMHAQLPQSCPTLCDMTHSPPGSSVHGILQTRILEWIAILFSRGSSRPRGQTWVSCIISRFFTVWATGNILKIWMCNRHMWLLPSIIQKQRYRFADKGLYSQSYAFSSSHVQMWEVYHKEGWVLKHWCFRTVVLEKTFESPLDCKEIQPVHSKGDQSWLFFGRNDAKAESPGLWPPHAKSWLIGKDSDAGRDWGQEEKGTTEDEMAGWHHGLNGRESEWTPGVDDGQGGLACCGSWGGKESDTTERLNWTELK